MKFRYFLNKGLPLLCLFALMLLLACGTTKHADTAAKVDSKPVDVYVVIEREVAERYWNIKAYEVIPPMTEPNYCRLCFTAGDLQEAVLLKNQLVSMGAIEVSFLQRD